jgi:N-acetylmuramoyl-L-alanine amidase
MLNSESMCQLCQFNRRRLGKLFLGAAAAGTILRPLLRAQAASALPTIMLDPGHGGHDPGAIAPDGTFEKTITLATGLTLRDTLAATGRYNVAMTREDDQFISLEDRVAAAMAAGADLFIAMHCDHLPTADYRGASVYTLSAEASDGLAAGIANDENSADRFGSVQTAAVSPQVAGILASLETRATRIISATFAEDIAASFGGAMPLMPDPIRSANFAVLRDPSTPSALLEMGCLTNPLDEKLLNDPEQRAAMASRLTAAIDLYFHDNPSARAG